MNRIICDTCGAEYSETLERCPVCTYPRQGTEKVVAAEAAAVAAKVKGGRFSSKNEKKRQKAQRRAAQAEQGGNPNKPLIVVIILLLIAILLAVFRGCENDKLSVDLPAGTYECTAMFYNVDPNTGSYLGCAGAIINITVLE